MNTEIIAQALAQAAKQRKAQGEPRYYVQTTDGLYLSANHTWVKSRSSALVKFRSPELSDWRYNVPGEFNPALMQVKQVGKRG